MTETSPADRKSRGEQIVRYGRSSCLTDLEAVCARGAQPTGQYFDSVIATISPGTAWCIATSAGFNGLIHLLNLTGETTLSERALVLEI